VAVIFALAASWLRIPGKALKWSALGWQARRGSDQGSAGGDVVMAMAVLFVVSLAAMVIIVLKIHSAFGHVSQP